jgi:streptogramin lyase
MTSRLRGSLFAAVVLLASGCECGGSPGDPCPGGCLIGEVCGPDGTCIPEPEPDAGMDMCIDGDGDHYGENCSQGPDCDDSDPTQHHDEVCDEMDNDCDTNVDEGVSVDPVCGCNPLCEREQIGEEGRPFDLDTDPNEGVVVDGEGNLRVLRRDSRVPHHLIWIANTGEGTISKVDTRTFVELARYRTGPLGTANDPSRTSVDADGDVYVGNRQGMSLTKIDSSGPECPDTNGDGVITTSTGPSDILEWGQDDCALWNTPLSGGWVRAVAAQEAVGPDGERFSNVWAGGWDASMVYKLDGNTGEILLSHSAPIQPYGFALDALGNLWMASIAAPSLGRVDTTDCDVDHCTTESIPLPGFGTSYGITVDLRQRVWIGGQPVTRYDPMAAPGDRWVTSTASGFVHGIGADARGNVWGAAMEQGIIRFDAEDPLTWAIVPASIGLSGKGIGIDDDGKVWAINMFPGDATVVVPREAIDEFTVWTGIAPGLVSPYTYSDMTGQQLVLATSAFGRYQTVIESCPPWEGMRVEYRELRWTGDVPDGTRLVWRGRTADTREALSSAGFIDIGSAPPDTSPIDVLAWMTEEGLTPGQFFELQVLMYPTTIGTTFVSPVVTGFELSFVCPDIIR